MCLYGIVFVWVIECRIVKFIFFYILDIVGYIFGIVYIGRCKFEMWEFVNIFRF